jgi:phospho-N-acetylmuramoyl-pentapeptide-transferase
MLLILLKYLQDWMGLSDILPYVNASVRMMLSALTTLVMTIFLGPVFIKKLYSMKIGQNIRTKKECPVLYELHEKKQDTPTMGGVLMVFSMIISLLLWMDLTVSFTWILLIATIWLGGVGAWDDYLKLRHKNAKGLKPKFKMIMQLILAIALAIYLLTPTVTEFFSHNTKIDYPSAKELVAQDNNTFVVKKQMKSLSTQQYISRIYIPFIKSPINLDYPYLRVIAFIFIIFVVIGTSNAVNLTDGLDGLAAGLIVMASAVLGLVAFISNNIEIAKYMNILYIEGSGEIAIYLFAMAGATLGFLWYNSFPAQVFMGDTGSLALGGVVGVASILLSRELLLSLVGMIFVIEALSVIIQVVSYRYRNKRRVFLCSPLHHHFEYKGWAETKIVMRFWIIALLFSIIGVISLKFQY